MMLSNRMKIALGLMAAVVAGTSVANARGMKGNDWSNQDPAQMQQRMQEHMTEHKERLFNKLNATDAQKQQISAIMDANKGNMDASMKQMQQMRGEMKTLRDAKVAKDDPKMVAMHEKMQQFHTEKQAQRQKVQSQIRAVLTPEQAKTFDEMNAKQEKRMDKFRNKMNP